MIEVPERDLKILALNTLLSTRTVPFAELSSPSRPMANLLISSKSRFVMSANAEATDFLPVPGVPVTPMTRPLFTPVRPMSSN